MHVHCPGLQVVRPAIGRPQALVRWRWRQTAAVYLVLGASALACGWALWEGSSIFERAASVGFWALAAGFLTAGQIFFLREAVLHRDGDAWRLQARGEELSFAAQDIVGLVVDRADRGGFDLSLRIRHRIVPLVHDRHLGHVRESARRASKELSLPLEEDRRIRDD